MNPREREERRRELIVVLALTIATLLFAVCVAAANAASVLTTPAPASAAAKVRVPDGAFMYRRMVEQVASGVWGVDASAAILAAQIHQESGYVEKAHSSVGAQGFAQFMPATAKWMTQQFPDRLGEFDPWDPKQSIEAAALYDQYLRSRNPGANPCATWSFALSAYNGGEKALHGEQALAKRSRVNPAVWFGAVARFRDRGAAAWTQNRTYVRQILTVLEPAYIDAGWSGSAVCA